MQALEASWTIPLEVVCRCTEENTDTLNLAALPGHLCQGCVQEYESNPKLEQKAEMPMPQTRTQTGSSYVAHRRKHTPSEQMGVLMDPKTQ